MVRRNADASATPYAICYQVYIPWNVRHSFSRRTKPALGSVMFHESKQDRKCLPLPVLPLPIC